MLPLYQDFYRGPDCFSAVEDADICFPIHIHSAIELAYVIEGELGVFLDGEKHLLAAGDMAIIQSNHMHGYESEHARYVMAIFSPSYVPSAMQIMKKKCFSSPVIRCESLPQELSEIIRRLPRCPGDKLVRKGMLYQLMGEIMRVNPLVDDVFDWQDDLLSRSLKEISERYRENLTLEDIAVSVNVSPNYLSRMFKQAVKCAIGEYCNRLRIEDAKNMLREKNDTVLSIAMDCGFENIRTFNRVFKEITGMTPKNYRNMWF